jgi:hypothetical protein
MHLFATIKPEHMLAQGKMSYAEAAAHAPVAPPALGLPSVLS